jgi:hypothetical protein
MKPDGKTPKIEVQESGSSRLNVLTFMQDQAARHYSHSHVLMGANARIENWSAPV